MNSARRHVGGLLTYASLTLICCGIFAAYEYTYRSGLEVSIDLSSSVASTAQLFFDTGKDFNEQESRITHIGASNGWQHLTFTLPPGRIRSLRFDPAMAPGRFVLHRVTIACSDGSEVLKINARDVLSFNQILDRRETPEGVAFTTALTSNDPSILFRLDQPLGFWAGVPLSLIRAVVVGSLLIGLLIWIGLSSRERLGSFFRRLTCRFDKIGKRLSVPGFLDFDGTALWFFTACFMLFLLGSVADWNGSSLEAYQVTYSDAKATEVAGEARPIRSDEWAFHTPAILNQVFRKDPLSTERSSVGGHSVALISNLPVRHYSTLFRPQFWSFFVLSPEYAFAVYWQFKALVLLTGVFCFLLLLSQSSAWSIIGSIWYFLSPHIQWTYSSPNLLPEMVGALCFAVVFFCLLLTASNYWRVAIGAVGFCVFALDFALCAYVPGLVPLVWVGSLAAIGVLFQQRSKVYTRSFAAPRLIATAAAFLTIAAVLLGVLRDAHSAIAAISNTIHPGKRVFSGGYSPIQYLLSNFFSFSESQGHVPSALLNICEASGFFWLAPAVLFSLHKRSIRKATIIALLCSFLLLLVWCVFPIPTYIGRIFGLDRTWASRCMPALGLANVAVVVVFLGSSVVPDGPALSIPKLSRLTGMFVGIFLVMVSVCLMIDELYGNYFSLEDTLLAALFVSVLVYLLMEGPRFLFASLLVTSHLLAWGLINPVERGLEPITSSSLFRFVRGHKALLDGKWIVFSNSYAAPGFLKATGCEVYNGEQYQPDFDHFRLFASNGLNVAALNRLGYLLMEPLPDGTKSSVQVETNAVLIDWKISPFDPIVRQLGIRYLAFDREPAPEISARLIALTPAPMSGFWLYALK